MQAERLSSMTVSLWLFISYSSSSKRTQAISQFSIVLSDGEPNGGYNFTNVEPLLVKANIPIYTIGYEADLSELKKLSALVEAASIDAGQAEVRYKIGSLLNAQM